MKYQLVISRSAEKNFYKLPASIQKRVRQVFAEMEENPYDGDVVRLRGLDAFRRRVGSYRILFRVTISSVTIFVIDIRKRDEKTYRGL